MLVKDVMNPDVKTIDKEETVQKAADEMTKFRVGSLIVVTDTRMIGIITERDILMKVVAEGKDVSKTKVKEVMTKNVIMIDPDADVQEAADIMTEKKIKKLPVIKKNQLIGIITATDICSVEPKLLEQLSSLMMVSGKKKYVAG